MDTKLPIFDAMRYAFAKSEISIAYVSRSGSYIPVPDQYAICPSRGGITSTWEKLKILMEFLGWKVFKLHTIEVHNPKECNVNFMDAIRLNFLQLPHELKYLSSLLLNNRPVIDVNYHKLFDSILFPVKDHDLDILEVIFQSTRDNKFPTNCMLRVFVEEKK